MVRKGRKPAAKPRAKKNVAPPASAESADVPAGEAPAGEAPASGHVLQRADGFYWEAKKGQMHGPYPTLAEAEEDMLAGGGAAEEDEGVESLQEAESELGISEWIDPDTGGPAEDSVPRIEDH